MAPNRRHIAALSLIGMGRQLRARALSPFVRQRLTFFVSKHRRSDLEELARYIETGQVTPIIDRSYLLADVPEALRHLEAGAPAERSPSWSESSFPARSDCAHPSASGPSRLSAELREETSQGDE